MDISQNVHLRQIADHFAFEWIKPTFRKWILDKLAEKLQHQRYNYPDKSIRTMRITTLLRPYTDLLDYLSNVHCEDTTKRYLDKIMGLPFTLKQIADNFDDVDRKEFKNRCKAIRRLAEKLERIGLLQSDLIHNEKWNIPYNRKQWNTRYWYIPGYHTDEDIEQWVIDEYRRHAQGLGRREDKIDKNAKEEITEIEEVDITEKRRQELINERKQKIMDIEMEKWKEPNQTKEALAPYDHKIDILRMEIEALEKKDKEKAFYQ